MPEGGGERESEVLDISDRVSEIIDGDSKFKSWDVKRLLRAPEVVSAPSVRIEMDYRGPDWAKWAKSFLEDYSAPQGQERSVAIRCTEKEKRENANVFGSGVEWIPSEE